MKLRKSNIAFLTLVISILTSCAKFEVPQKEIGKTTVFKELKVEESFDWKTTQKYTLKITGLETLNPVFAALQIETSSGQIIHQEKRSMNESFNLELNLPLHEKKIIVKYGSLMKEIELNSNQLDFDYTQARPEEITE